jgi:uncharacterized membrane protein HdeD (DUF308 family)
LSCKLAKARDLYMTLKNDTYLQMKKLLFTNWHLMRWVRFILAFAIGFHAIATEDYFFLFFALFFLIQALFDTGCGSKGCTVPKD